MNIHSLQKSLQEVAKQLRPVTRSPYIPLIRLANKYSIEVELRFYSGAKKREAQTEINSNQPRILIYREAGANGAMPLAPDKEHLLTPRERFSIAHELGHFLAFKNFGALPILREVDHREYRRQEACMDEFAQSLLVPDWLAKHWLTKVSDEEPISLNNLMTWAVTRCGVSREVVAKALTKFEPSIGFLKAAEAVRLANNKRMLVVFYSTYGTDLQLPNIHSFIDDEIFVNTIEGASGTNWIDDCHFGNVTRKKLNVAWKESKMPTSRRRREFKSTVKLSGKGYWISVRSDNLCADSELKKQIQLTLFD